jgi:hypothetical protein
MRITLQCDLLFSYDVAFLNLTVDYSHVTSPSKFTMMKEHNLPMGSTHSQ